MPRLAQVVQWAGAMRHRNKRTATGHSSDTKHASAACGGHEPRCCGSAATAAPYRRRGPADGKFCNALRHNGLAQTIIGQYILGRLTVRTATLLSMS